MSESAPFCTVVPMDKDKLLSKMTTLSKFVRQRNKTAFNISQRN